MTGTSLPRARAKRRLIAGSVAPHRGLLGPQYGSCGTKSNINSAVVFGSTITDLSSGAVGAMTLPHSAMMSAACIGQLIIVAIARATIAAPRFMTSSDFEQFVVVIPSRTQSMSLVPHPVAEDGRIGAVPLRILLRVERFEFGPPAPR